MAKTFCVVYRTGGRERFNWHRTSPTRDRNEADEQCNNIRLQGYKAFVENYEKSKSIGLPETWDPNDPV